MYGHEIDTLHDGGQERLHPLEEVSSSSPDSSWVDAAKDLETSRGMNERKTGESVDDVEPRERESLEAGEYDTAQEQPFNGTEAEGATPDVESPREMSGRSEHFHYCNLPMWTTPKGLILTGWRMRCPVCYHQDGHSLKCSECEELPVILWIQLMFIHGIVHYMTYADGEWW